MTNQGSQLQKIHWRQILLLGIAMPLLCSITFVIWYASDENRLKPHIENVASQFTGRTLNIKGDFNFTLGWVSTISAKNIDWYNPSWSSSPMMLHIDSIEVSIDLGSLRKDLITITEAKVDGAELIFEWSDGMPMNWDMRDPNATPSDEPLQPIPLALLQAQLNDVKLRFIHPSLADEILIDIDRATESQGNKNSLVLDANLSINTIAIDLNGEIGPFQELLIAGAIDYKLDALGANITLKTNGKFADLADLSSPDIRLQLEATEIKTLLEALKLNPVTQGPAKVEARLKTTDNVIDTAIQGHVGEFNINGLLTTRDITSLNDLKLSIMSDGPSARTIGVLAGINTLPDSPYTLKIKADRIPEGLRISHVNAETGGIRINGSGMAHRLPQIRDLDIKLNVFAEQLSSIGNILGIAELPNLPFSATASASSSEDLLDTIDTKFSLGNATGAVRASISAAKDLSGSKIDLTLSSKDIREASKQYDLEFKTPIGINLKTSFTLAPKSIDLESFELNLGNNTLSSSGGIRYGDQLGGSLKTTATGKNLNNLVGQLLTESAQASIPAKPWKLNGDARYQNGVVTIESSSATIGDTKLGFKGTFKFNNAMPLIDADISAAGNNLAKSLETIDAEDIPSKKFSINAHINTDTNGIQLSSIEALIDNDTISGDINSLWPGEPTKLSFDISAKGKNLDATLPQIPIYKPPASPYRFHAIASFTDNTIEIQKLDAQLAEANLSLQGKIEPQKNNQTDELAFKFSGPRMSDIGKINNIKFPPEPFSVSAKLKGNNELFNIDNLSIQMKKNDIHGDIRFNLQGKPTFSAVLASNYLNTNEIIKKIEKTKDYKQLGVAEPDSKTTSKPLTSEEAKRILSSDPINFVLLKKIDGKLDLRFKTFESFGRTIKNLDVSAVLKDGHLNVSTIQGDTSFGDLNGSFSINSARQPTAVEGKFNATQVILASSDLTSQDRAEMPRHNLVTEIQTKGDSFSELGAQLNGYFWIQGRNGRLLSTKLNVLFGDFFLELLNTLNPFYKKSEYAELACDAAYLQFTDGIIETAPAVILQTDKISIVAAGKVSLNTEKIDIGFKTTALKGIGLSAGDIVNPFIKLGGSLSKPTIVPDPKDTVIQGGAAVATMGVSLLATSFWNRWVGATGACPKMYQRAIKIRKKISPDNIPVLPDS